jgi:SAM-dependent methyltransferase
MVSSDRRGNGIKTLSPPEAWNYIDSVLHFFGKRVLDIGVGQGESMRHMMKLGAKVTGLDRDPETVQTLRDVTIGDVTSIPYSANSFDLVTAFETLHELSQHKDAIKEMKRVGEVVAAEEEEPPTDPEQIRFLELDRKHGLGEDLRPGSYWADLLGPSVKRYPYIRRARLPTDVRPILEMYVKRFNGSLEEYLEAWNRAYGGKEWIDQVCCLFVVEGKN